MDFHKAAAYLKKIAFDGALVEETEWMEQTKVTPLAARQQKGRPRLVREDVRRFRPRTRPCHRKSRSWAATATPPWPRRDCCWPKPARGVVLAGRNLDKARDAAASLAPRFGESRVSAARADGLDPASLAEALRGAAMLLVASPTIENTGAVAEGRARRRGRLLRPSAFGPAQARAARGAAPAHRGGRTLVHHRRRIPSGRAGRAGPLRSAQLRRNALRDGRKRHEDRVGRAHVLRGGHARVRRGDARSTGPRSSSRASGRKAGPFRASSISARPSASRRRGR